MNAKQWQIDLAKGLGAEDGREAVDETLTEQGERAVLDELTKILCGQLNAWEEAAAAASAHALHRDLSDHEDPEDAADPFVWDDETRPAYYRAYAAASLARAKEIAEV